jgi:Protein of unknown function (DUF1203)
MASATALKIVPLPTPLPAGLGAPNTVTRTVDDPNSYPCRRCLMDGKLGEELVLLSYDPFFGTSPYRGPGPIFVHKHECNKYQSNNIPDQQRRRQLALRGYDKNHMMQRFAVVEGTNLEDEAKEFFDNEQVDYIHVHYAAPGCFALRLERGMDE